jgi:cytochrome c biogenesis factor
MLFSEYLHEKAEESRHNETVGYLIIIIGSIFFIGGLLETVIKVENPEWFLIIPYHITPHPYSLLGLALTSIGLALLTAGIVVSVHYAKERGWYMKEIHKAHSVEEKRLKIQRKFSSEQSYGEQELKTKRRKT